MAPMLSQMCSRLRMTVARTVVGGVALLASSGLSMAQSVSSGLLGDEVEASIGHVQISETWWEPHVAQAQSRTLESVPLTLNDLLISALANSSQIKVFSDIPLIRETSILESQGRFDWHAFAETSWDSASHPVGSTLDTGVPGINRLIQDQSNLTVGVKKQTVTGGTVNLRQRIGTFDNNSRFLVPQNQGNSRLSLSFTQPLLNGAGRPYNTSVILLSEIDANIAQDEFSRQLQSHLLEVTRAFWTLHLERALLLQKQNLYRHGIKVQQSLNARAEIDVVESQLVLVDAAVAERKADLIRAAAAVRNSEARIRALVNDPGISRADLEFIPLDVPTLEYIPLNVQDVQTEAITQRPEVLQNIRQVQAAGVRLNMSKNELLPQLNAIFEVYAEGLRGDYNVSQALGDQFSTGRPSYNVGLQYDIPIGNRVARGRYSRREIELRQMQNQLATTIATLSLEAEVAVREIDTSYAEMQLKYQSMNAAVKRVSALKSRWEKLPGEDQAGSLYLQNLLDSQAKATATESDFARAKLTYSLALMNLKKATGSLLKYEMVSQLRVQDGPIPQIVLDKPGMPTTADPQPTMIESDE